MANILVTGASGFIGSFVVEAALKRGLRTWAGMRSTSSHRFLPKEGFETVELDYENRGVLCQKLRDYAAQYGAFDYVVHCAGVTKCSDKADFDRVNFQHTKNLVDALRQTGLQPRLFVFISTLSVFGPIHEESYEPIKDTDTPQPNTAYGISKLKAEQYLQSLPDFPYVIFRPTGVYGPREKDYYLMAKSIKQHIDFSVGYKRQDLTFVYVKDVVKAVFLAIDKQASRKAYFLTDGRVYQSRTFSNLIIRELKARYVLRICSPLFVLKVVSAVAGWLAQRTHSVSTLNLDKYKIMKQRNWRCDMTPTVNDLGYEPEYPLDRGVKETIEWYKEEGWL